MNFFSTESSVEQNRIKLHDWLYVGFVALPTGMAHLPKESKRCMKAMKLASCTITDSASSKWFLFFVVNI